jgi:hypothetical protein
MVQAALGSPATAQLALAHSHLVWLSHNLLKVS